MESTGRHAEPVSSGDVPNGEPTFQPKTCDICFCEKAEHDCIRCALALCNGCGDHECDITNRNPHWLTPRVICSPRKCARCGATIEDGESAPAAARCCQWCKRLICSYDCRTAHEQECAWQQPSSSDSEENWVRGTRPRRARARGAAGRPPEGQDAEGRTIYSLRSRNLLVVDHEESFWWREGQRVIVRDSGREDLDGRTGTVALCHYDCEGGTERFYVAIDNDSTEATLGQAEPLAPASSQPTATVEASELRSMLSYRQPLACRDGSGTTTPLGEAVAKIFGLKPALPRDADKRT